MDLLDIRDVGSAIGVIYGKFEIRNPKLETIPKFKIQMTKTGASTCVFLGLSTFDTRNCFNPFHGTGGRKRNTKIQMKKWPKYDAIAIYVLNLEHSIFGFVSDFGFRYSDL